MDAPVCPICGEKHWYWLRVCDASADPKSVTKRHAVRDAPVTAIDLAIENAALRAEVERLGYEVMHLKAMLANEHQKTVPVEERNRIARPVPLSPAERAKRYRASKRKP